MYTTSSGKATSKECAEKYLALCLFPGEDVEQLLGRGAPAAPLRETRRDFWKGGRCQCRHSSCSSILTLPWHLSAAGSTDRFGYQNMPPVCSLGTNISTVNIILWDLHLDYRHDWLRVLLWLIFELVIFRFCFGQKEGVENCMVWVILLVNILIKIDQINCSLEVFFVTLKKEVLTLVNTLVNFSF